LLKTLKIKIPIETLFAEKGLKLDQEKMTVTKLDRMDVNATNVYINGARPLDQFVNPFKPGTIEHAIEEGKKADLAESDAAALLGESEAEAALIESELALREAENAIREATLAALFARLGLDAEGNPVTINVTVEGSVIAAEDLAETITDIQYTYQRTGKGLLFSSIAI
jgi:hypothetical protein